MTDYIKREDALNSAICLYTHWIEESDTQAKDKYYAEGRVIIEAINQIPSADVVERKRGEWILKTDEVLDIDFYACSECEYEPYRKMDISNFCPNCGADMREQTERSE